MRHLPLAPLALVSTLGCGGAPTAPAPTPAPDQIIFQLTPSEGTLAWTPRASGWQVSLAPSLNWRAEFVGPATSRTLLVTVRLQNPAGTVCLWSYARLDVLAYRGSPYTVQGGNDYALPHWPENPCGDTFTITMAEVAVREGSSDAAPLLSRLVPCSFRFERR